MEPITLFSVGHGNRSIAELLDILQRCGIATVVDIRANPQSRRHPQFEGDSLRQAIESSGLVYHWAGRHLGGRRAPRATSRHAALTDDGLRGFADHMDTPDFACGVSQLRNLAARSPTAMLCAERDPAQCHRSLIADWLTLQGVQIVHLLAPGESRPHLLSRHARRESTELVYDRTDRIESL